MSTQNARPISIEATANGPYVVTGLDHVRNAKGEPQRSSRGLVLCRCGGSANKPFCDGTHQRNGFNGARTSDAPLDSVRAFAGANIVVHDNRAICAHAARCSAGAPTVFNSENEPWITPDDAASVESLIETVRRCPSGALSYTVEGVHHELHDDPPS